MLLQVIRCLAQPNLELANSSHGIWQGDVDTLFKTTSDGRVQLPGNVGGAQHQDTVVVVAHTLHLYQEFSFNSARGFILTLTSGAAERINFVDENDCWLILSR